MFSRHTTRGLLLARVCPMLMLARLTFSAVGAESPATPANDVPASGAQAEAGIADPQPPSTVPSSPAEDPDATPTPDSPDGPSAAKQQILESAEWNAAIRRFREWLSVQVAYPPEEVPELQERLRQKVDAMSVVELQQFLSEMETKLDILSSPEGVQARTWARQYLRLLSDSRAAEFRQRIPDVVNMTAAQMREALAEIQQIQADKAARSQRFDSFRAAEVQAANARAQSQAQAAAAARAAAPRGNLHPGFTPSALAPRAPVQRYPGVGTGTWARVGWW